MSIGQSGFLKHIVAEGIARHKRKIKPFVIKGNSISGFGIYASREIKPGEFIFSGEEKATTIGHASSCGKTLVGR